MADNNNPENFDVKVDGVPAPALAPPSSFAPPAAKPYSGDAGGASPVRVSTEAIDWFVSQLKQIAPHDGSGFIATAIDAVKAVDIRPGAFGKAQALKLKIDGDSGLKGDTDSFLQGVRNVLIMLQDSLVVVSKGYQDTEDDSTITVDKLKEEMDRPFQLIDGWQKSGQAEGKDSSAPPKGDGSQSGWDPANYPNPDADQETPDYVPAS